jgi:hypothetical protein
LIQKMSVAAMQMAEKKVRAHLWVVAGFEVLVA